MPPSIDADKFADEDVVHLDRGIFARARVADKKLHVRLVSDVNINEDFLGGGQGAELDPPENAAGGVP